MECGKLHAALDIFMEYEDTELQLEEYRSRLIIY